MTVGTILYIFLFLVSILISILYLEFGAMALIGLVVTIPVFMFVFLLILRKRVSVAVDSKNPLAEKDAIDKPARAVITLSVENRSRLFPVTKGIARVRYENPFSGDKGKLKIRFSVDTGKKRDRRIPVIMDNCGNVAITVEKVRIYDYLNIFAWTIGKNFETQDVLVLPPTKEMYLGKDKWYNETSEDSDRFSVYKKGDDPSEIFDIRDYADGDKIQRIHWKLSSKTGNLMVKEGSLPLTKQIHIFIDLCAKGDRAERNHKINLLVQGVYSIAMFMIEHGIPQAYIWYDKKNGVIQEYSVEQEEELYWMFQELFKSSITAKENELLEAYVDWGKGKLLESAIYLTVADHDSLDSGNLVRDRLEVMDLRGDGLEDQE
ncbi:MAG: DUF58 domain-containing protein [Eubacterium sp.]|nr:DUF58 domain-containing protein [Eubacterium sp.]